MCVRVLCVVCCVCVCVCVLCVYLCVLCVVCVVCVVCVCVCVCVCEREREREREHGGREHRNEGTTVTQPVRLQRSIRAFFRHLKHTHTHTHKVASYFKHGRVAKFGPKTKKKLSPQIHPYPFFRCSLIARTSKQGLLCCHARSVSDRNSLNVFCGNNTTHTFVFAGASLLIKSIQMNERR